MGVENNNGVSDSNRVEEQTVVHPAGPKLVTTASPATVTLPAPVPTVLTDSAVLSGGFNPTGSMVFMLTGPNGVTLDTETVSVNGNGTYSTPTGFRLPTTGIVAGTYTWSVTYLGDANNNGVSDSNPADEHTVVHPASPKLVTDGKRDVEGKQVDEQGRMAD